MSPFLVDAIQVLLIGYLLLMAGLVIARLVVSSRAVKGMLQTTISMLSLLSFVGLLLAILVQNWILVAPMLAIAVYDSFHYLPHLMPRADDVPEDALQVLTFNLEIRQEEDELAELAQIIRDSNADIVGLQELSPEGADYFAEHLKDMFPHQALHPNEGNIYAGQGVLSRYPIEGWDYWGYPEEGDSTLGHIEAHIKLDGRTVTVYNTHPMPPVSFDEQFEADSHEKEMQKLFDKVLETEKDHPVLLMGDFNMTQHFEDYDRFTEYFEDALRVASPTLLGLTFPATDSIWPAFIQLDYIFYDEDQFSAYKAHVIKRAGASDHYPVWAAFEFLK
jgi:endonuclease/exonuclease/phosphatase family metal-dependent hydrolase